MEIYVRNTNMGLMPLYPSDYDEKRKLRIGQDYKAVITNPRNLGFHKKFFALLNLAHQNHNLDLPFEGFRAYILIKAGYVNILDTPKGAMYLPKSISFASMSQDEFEECYNRVVNILIKELGITSEMIEGELKGFM